MSYVIHLFAFDADKTLSAFQNEASDIASQTEAKMRQDDSFSKKEIAYTKKYVDRILNHEIKIPSSESYFNAMCWIFDTISEKIVAGSLQGFRRLSYLDEIGFWNFFLNDKPPFAIPVSDEKPPQIGYLNHDSIANVVLELKKLSPSKLVEANYGRQEIIEILESVSDDKLDLLAVLTE
jgi:hypothetical protein